ncbi:MAG TPA: hypothetical protein VMF52_09800 [Steroidobacteraceae bacterium]|nr:hypothetical protein [Steroidobacteraceae bacterium]
MRLFLLLLMGTGVAAAADVRITHPCASLGDREARLACYDAAFPPPTNATSSDREKEFGKVKPPPPKDAVASVSAAVSQVERRKDGRFVATLDNGQVWSQSELQSQAVVAAGDTVTIKRALLGSFLLVTRDGIATRVKRVR